MAKRTGDGELIALLGVLLVAGAYIYLKSGRGKVNSPLLPDMFEDPIDRVVAALNQRFGHRWVNLGLNAVQAYIEQTMPGVAAVVQGVFWAEQTYGQNMYAGRLKKQYATNYRY